LRLRLAGGRVVLDPAIRIFYRPRATFSRLFRQYYEYGRWKAPVMRKHGRPTSLRSLVPGACVASLVLLPVVGIWLPAALWLLAIAGGAYAAGAISFGALFLRRRREPWRLLPLVVAAYPTMHVAHGLGMLVGWLRAAVGLRSGLTRNGAAPAR
jgi:hypothetical protein